MTDSETYISNQSVGNYYGLGGADTVLPFNGSDEYKKLIIDAMAQSDYGLSYDSTWDEIAVALADTYAIEYVTLTGSYYFVHNACGSQSQKITFSKPFIEKPTVVITSKSGNYAHLNTVYPSGVSTTGFTLVSSGAWDDDSEWCKYTAYWKATGYVKKS